MVRHWNEVPHRFGLFGVNGEVRPQYFVFRMLAEMGEVQVHARSDTRGIRVLAGRSGALVREDRACEDRVCVLLVNHDLDFNRDQVARLQFRGLKPGPRQLTVTRIDGQRRWDAGTLTLLPLEQRDTYVGEAYECQVLLPANSVAQVTLAERREGR
jgi:xylan 1,4-beta-xylosidase